MPPGIYHGDSWWTLRGEDLANAVSAIGEDLWLADEPRRVEVEKNLRRFGGKLLRGLWQGRDPSPDMDNARLNVTKSVTETLTAKVGSIRPRPKILTNGADHSLRTRAKKLQRFLDGIYRQTSVYKLTPTIFRDALLTGTGVASFFPLVGKRTIGIERVFPLEVLIDSVEAINGTTQNLWRVKYLDKDVLKGMFPKATRDIENLATVSQDELPDYIVEPQQTVRGNRMVKVFEAFHAAVYAEDGTLTPGCRAIASGRVLLCYDEWEYDFFPYEFFHWSEPVRGFWGDSAVGEIRGLEREINRLLQKVQRAMRLVGQPWVLNPRGGKVKPAKITNETALVLDYDGPSPPTVVTFQPIHPQVIEQIWTLHSKAYAQLGTNELQASATKPPGIDSGRGLEQLSEEHLVRFKHVSKSFEDFVAIAFARQFLRCAECLDERLKDLGHSEGYVVRATASKTVLKISWSEAKITPDDFFLETWPTSALPLTPSGRTEEVERWQANGWIDAQRAQTLLEFPDLDSETDLATADSELLEWQLEQMIDDGKETYPIEEQDLQRAKSRAAFALEHALIDGTPATHCDRLRDFMTACDEMLAPPAPPDAMGMEGAGMPGAAPPDMGMGGPPPGMLSGPSMTNAPPSGPAGLAAAAPAAA